MHTAEAAIDSAWQLYTRFEMRIALRLLSAQRFFLLHYSIFALPLYQLLAAVWFLVSKGKSPEKPQNEETFHQDVMSAS